MEKVKFKIADKEKIAEFIFDLRNCLDINNLSQRNYSPCIYIKFKKEFAESMINSHELDNSLKEKIISNIKISKEESRKMALFTEQIKGYWDKEISDIFFSNVKETIGKDFIEKEYICYITNKVVGSYFNKSEITIDYNEKMSSKKGAFILAEEIVHLIYWNLWKEIYQKDISDIDNIFSIKGDKYSCWHIAEIIPEYILVDNPSFNSFGWNKRKRYLGYPWIIELRKILDPLWENKKSFMDFVINAHKQLNIIIK